MPNHSRTELSTSRVSPLAWMLIASCALFILYLPRYYLGYFNDDAIFVIGALSLWKGSFLNLSNPTLSVINRLGIGFPLVLAPWVKLVSPHYEYLKVIPLLLSLGSVVLTYTLARLYLPLVGAVGVAALLAANPTFSTHASLVMADPCFVFVILMCFVRLHRHLTNNADQGLILGLLLGWVWLIRPAGGLAIVAVLGAIAVSPRKRTLWKVGVTACLPWAIQSVHHLLRTGTTNQYFDQWGQALPYLSNPAHLADQTIRVLHTFFVYSALGIHTPYTPWAKVLSAGLSVVILLLCSMGLFGELRRSAPRSTLAFGMGLFSGLYLLMHLLWPAITQRYALPLLPLVFLFCAIALNSMLEATAHSPRVWRGLLLGVLALYGYRHVRELQSTYISVRPGTGPFPETLRWIKRETPPDALVLGRAPLVYLATGRRGYMQIVSLHEPAFYEALLQLGVTHILSQPGQILSAYRQVALNDTLALARQREWITRNASHYKPVYANAQEYTEIYEVLRPARKGAL